MSRKVLFGLFGLFILGTSCERCMTCSYSYTETTIIQTVNGEEEEIEEYNGRYILDEDGVAWSQECFKKGEQDDFTIDDAYEEEKKTTSKDDFEYTCVEQ